MPIPSSVLYIEPSGAHKVSFDGKEFGTLKNKQTVIASRVFYNDIVIHSFKINTTVSDDELRTMVEIKMYEEAGLDLNKRYKIVYVKKHLEFSDTMLVEAFAIEEEKSKTALQNVLKQEKYIDFLLLPFLSFETLYTRKILAPKNDVFVYIDENEAFLALYKNGQYISTKSIITLSDIVKRLQKEDITLSIDELLKILREKGLDSATYPPEENMLALSLQSIFGELFTKINDILLHNRNVYGFEHVDRMYINVANARLKGLREFLHAFGFADTVIADFNLFKNCSSEFPMSCIFASYVLDAYLQNDMRHNGTFFLRPPQFLKTHTGKFVIFSLAATLLLSLYPIYLSAMIYTLDEQLRELSVQNEAIKKNAATFNAQLNGIKKELKETTELKTAQTNHLALITESIDSLYEMKSGTKTYTDFVLHVNTLLKKYSLMVRSIEQKGASHMSIEVVATPAQRDTIAKFMEDLLKEGFLGVTTNEIRLDKELYISKIEIER